MAEPWYNGEGEIDEEFARMVCIGLLAQRRDVIRRFAGLLASGNPPPMEIIEREFATLNLPPGIDPDVALRVINVGLQRPLVSFEKLQETHQKFEDALRFKS